MISRRISGDSVTCSIEDNYSDLCIAALNSITGFNIKTGEDFDQMMRNKLFDQYTKTVLWNAKNKKGVGVELKRPMRNKMQSIDAVSSDGEEYRIEVEDKSSGGFDSVDFLDSIKALDPGSMTIIESILGNADIFTSEGRLKLSELSRYTGFTVSEVKKHMATIGRVLNVSVE